MSNKSHRSNADAARAAAAATNLPNVRERHLRSAQVHDEAAAREEEASAGAKARLEEAATRKVERDRETDENRGRGSP